MRRSLRRFAIVAGVGLLLAGGVVAAGYWALLRPVTLAEPRTVTITPRSSLGYVAKRLEARGIIPNALAFRLYARLTGQAGRIKVGEYEVTDGQRPVDILDMLVEGRVKSYWVTVPEGKWAAEIPPFFAEQWPEAAAEMPALFADAARWPPSASLHPASRTLEGYLFPDTYRFARGVTGAQVVAAMLKRFDETCGKAYREHPPADGRTLHQVLVLASLVEGEAKVAEERAVIAGVYMNRLRRGMPLQCDATVLYAHGRRLSRVLYRDLEIDSPYNTYRYPGLPPGPINNPGLAAFAAALRPAEVPYLYYVARPDGSHEFTRTLAEHEAAIRRIRGR